jgi:hypothetical protein
LEVWKLGSLEVWKFGKHLCFLMVHTNAIGKNIVKVMEDKMINGIEKISNVIISRAPLLVIEMKFSDRYS